MNYIFKTIHGSYLYGTNHPGSDLDIYYVIPNDQKPQKQHTRWNKVTNQNEDIIEVRLDDFVKQLEKGSPQAIEAYWSPLKTWNNDYPEYRDFLENFRLSLPRIKDTYVRTIKSLSLSGDRKSRLQAVRHTLDYLFMERYGFLDPIHSEHLDLITSMEEEFKEEELWLRLSHAL